MPGDKVGAVLVVGGGISGMQSSLDLADSDFKVYLLDKLPSIGGVMAQLDKTFPTNDCAMCIMAPKLVGTGRHHNIEIISNAELESIEGEAGNFKVNIIRHPRRIDENKCTGCGICATKCPVVAVDEYNMGLKKRAATSVRYPQAVPLRFSIDKDKCIGCGICQGECKAGAVIYDEDEKKIELNVGSVILSPGFDIFKAELKSEYGYGKFKNVVTSMEFERFLSATGPYTGMVLRPSDGDIPEKVAFIQCVGSRDSQKGNEYCSSVCCMYSMKEAVIAQEHTEGLKAQIFFMDLRAFGKEFDDYYTRAQDEHGIKFTRCRVSNVEEVPETKNLNLTYIENDEVKREEFNMVVLSIGFTPPPDTEDFAKRFGIELNKYNFCKTSSFTPLETSRPGIYVSGAFSGPKDIPDTVAQASGAAAKASSLIASERGKLITIKEYPPERDVSGEEPRIGVFICHCGINIGGTVDVPGVVEYAKTLPNVVHSEHNLYTCSDDTQKRMKEKIEELQLNRTIVASCTPRTHEPLFRSTTREGGLNQYLFEMANIRDQCSWIHMHDPKAATKKAKDLIRMAVSKSRFLEPLKNPELPLINSALVIGGGISGITAAVDIAQQGFEVHLVEKEAELGGNLKRLHFLPDGIDLKEMLDKAISNLKSFDNAYIHTEATLVDTEGFLGNFKSTISEKGEKTEIEHGVAIIATGAKEYSPKEYKYGEDDRVLTQLELEEKLANNEFNADNVVMIQCIGSRNDEFPNCSRVCCTNAISNALEIKKLKPDTNVYVLNKDIRTFSFKEDYFKEAMEKGVIFIRYDDDNKPILNDDFTISIKDGVLNNNVQLKPDLLVLSAGIRANKDNEELAKLFKLPLSKDKYFLEAHMKLRPVDFATEGVFLCGMAHWPKFIDESISQASGTAARALTFLSKDKLEADGIVANVNDRLCAGCGVCEAICEYKAIEVTENISMPDRQTALVNEGVCKGCGACVGACPSGAVNQKGFKNNQINRMIEAFLEAV
jgi:heterodisulfide reductase subunit A